MRDKACSYDFLQFSVRIQARISYIEDMRRRGQFIECRGYFQADVVSYDMFESRA